MEYTRITLRIPKDLHKDLSESAKQSSNSLNAEIIKRLRETHEIDRSGIKEIIFEAIYAEEFKRLISEAIKEELPKTK